MLSVKRVFDMTVERKEYLRKNGTCFVGTVVAKNLHGLFKPKFCSFVVRIVLQDFTVCELSSEKFAVDTCNVDLLHKAVNVYVDNSVIARFGVQSSSIDNENYFIDLENV